MISNEDRLRWSLPTLATSIVVYIGMVECIIIDCKEKSLRLLNSRLVAEDKCGIDDVHPWLAG